MKARRNRRNLKAVVRHSWRDHEMMSVTGCIDAHGAITARACKQISTHSPEESRGKRWRWLVWSQEMAGGIPGRTVEEINNPRMNELTAEEAFAVWDWLAKHGFTDERTMPNTSVCGPSQQLAQGTQDSLVGKSDRGDK